MKFNRTMENITNDYLLSLIGSRGEGVSLDYKRESYAINVNKQDKNDKEKVEAANQKKRDLIIDLTAMANSNGDKLAVIITGVEENQQEGTLTRKGIQHGVYSDHTYQPFVKTAIDPPIQFEYQEIRDHTGLTFGVFIIR